MLNTNLCILLINHSISDDTGRRAIHIDPLEEIGPKVHLQIKTDEEWKKTKKRTLATTEKIQNAQYSMNKITLLNKTNSKKTWIKLPNTSNHFSNHDFKKANYSNLKDNEETVFMVN